MSADKICTRHLARKAVLYVRQSATADSSGRRNASTEEVAVTTRRRRSDRSGRGALRSPGRPPVARREDRRRFWAAVAAGRASEDAAADAGVSPAVGVRWFRQAGGMPPSHLSRSRPTSGRSLSFAEREELALLRAQGHWRSPAACGERRPRSPASCAATPPHAAAA